MDNAPTAVILAAGEGRRLEPLTNRRPKPMLPVGNKPLLEHVLVAARDAEITDFVFVVGYERDRIQTHFADGDAWDVSIEYTTQEKQLGTAHALKQAQDLVDGRFIVLNGDRIIEPSIVKKVYEKTENSSAGAAIAVTRVSNATSYGVVELDGNAVDEIIEKPTGQSTSELINAGVYSFDTSIFEAIDQIDAGTDGEYGLTNAINHLLKTESVLAVRYRGWWLDVSYPWDLLSVAGQVLDRNGGDVRGDVASSAHVDKKVYISDTASVSPNTVIEQGSTVGENVHIGPNVSIKRSVIFPDATIDAGSVLKDCIVGANATVGANVTIPGGRGVVVIDGELYHYRRFGGVIGDNADIGGAAVLEPGTLLGDEVVIGPGTIAGGTIEDGVEIRRG